MTLDISDTLAANSNQMNAADIVGVTPTVQITHVERMNDEKQPLKVYITGGYKPWFPCKTVRRILSEAWGADAGQWIGRWVTLYREPTVVYANEEVGGIRVSALSNIPGGMTVKLKERKTGKPSEYKIAKLTPPATEKPVDADLRAFRSAISDAMKRPEHPWTEAQIKLLLGCGSADVAPERRAELVAILKKPPVQDAGEGGE